MIDKGIFNGKAIILDEPLDLPMDSRVVVRVEREDAPDGLLEWIENNAVDAPELPSDLSHQHDHYLYGTEKKPNG